MIRLDRILLFSFTVVVLIHVGNTLSRSDRSGPSYQDNRNFKADTRKDKYDVGYTENKPVKRGLGISAWGIVAILLTFILSGIFIYYFLLFYPIMCRKERKYDVVGNSRDTTPTPIPNNIEKIP